jgi:hypothetical protein
MLSRGGTLISFIKNSQMASISNAAATLAVVVSTFVACKAPEASKVKTLDAVASGGITKLYQCIGTNQARITADRIVFDKNAAIAEQGESEKSVLRGAVMDYFTAIQPAMQDMFLNLGGSVLITDDAHIGDYCRAGQTQPSKGTTTDDSLHGCFVFADDPSGQKPSIFTIVHTGSAEKIRYYGPQIFGYLYAQFYSRLAPPTREGANFSIQPTESVQFISYKEAIADAFLNDMLASSKFNLDNLSPVLGLNASKELRGYAGNSGLLDALSLRKAGDADDVAGQEKERRRAQIRDFFFAHAFQSMNCNAEALEVTRREFPKSLEAYNQINGALLQISSRLAGAGQFTTGKSSALQRKSSTIKAGAMDLTMLLALLPMLNQQQNFNPRAGYPSMQNQYMGNPLGYPSSNRYQNPYQNQYQQGQGGSFPMFANLFPNLLKSFGDAGQSGSSCSGSSCCGGNCSTCANGTCGPSCASCGVDSVAT